MTDKPAQKIKPVGVVAGLGGFLAAKLLGSVMWIPAGAAIVLSAAFNAWRKHRGQTLSAVDGAVIVICSQLVWMVVGAAYTSDWAQVAIDLGLMSAAVIALLLLPNRLVFAAVIAFTSLLLVYGLTEMVSAEGVIFKAWTMHSILRAGTVGLLIVAWWRDAQRRALHIPEVKRAAGGRTTPTAG